MRISGVDQDKNHMFFYSDGGPDHNVVHIQVQLSFIALFLAADFDSLLAARTPPYLSVLNPAERFMSVGNIALNSLTLCQDQLSPDEDKIVSKLVTKAQWRDAQIKEALKKPEERIDIKDLAKKCTITAMKTLTERFSSLTYDENNVIVVEGVSESEITNLMSH